jgi:hypothetical protein
MGGNVTCGTVGTVTVGTAGIGGSVACGTVGMVTAGTAGIGGSVGKVGTAGRAGTEAAGAAAGVVSAKMRAPWHVLPARSIVHAMIMANKLAFEAIDRTCCRRDGLGSCLGSDCKNACWMQKHGSMTVDI